MSVDPSFDLDFDAEVVKDWFRLGIRRIPTFKKTIEVLDTFEKSVAASIVNVNELYDKIKNAPSTFTASGFEILLVPDVVFKGCGKDRPPLFENTDIISRTCGLASEQENARVAKRIFYYFFSDYPDKSPIFPQLAQACNSLYERFSAEFPEKVKVFKLFDIGAPANIASWLPPTESISEFSEDSVVAKSIQTSVFCQRIWEKRLGLYKKLLTQAAEDRRNEKGVLNRTGLYEAEEKALALITKDTCIQLDSGEIKLRYVSAPEIVMLYFLKAITSQYDINSVFSSRTGKYPYAILDALKEFLLRIFPKVNSKWPMVQREMNRLFEFWEQGKQLIKAFDVADWLVRKLGNNQFQWTQRYNFWVAYWRAGRIKETRIYIRESKMNFVSREYGAETGKSLPVSLIGCKGSGATKVYLGFLITGQYGDVVALEGSENFSLRIGTLGEAQRAFWNSPNPRCEYMMDWCRAQNRIPHNLRWENDANGVIGRLTGLPRPGDTA